MEVFWNKKNRKSNNMGVKYTKIFQWLVEHEKIYERWKNKNAS